MSWCAFFQLKLAGLFFLCSKCIYSLGCERLSVFSKSVCGVILQNTVFTEVCLALEFPLRSLYIWLKTIANKQSDTHNLEILSFFIVLVLFLASFSFFEGKGEMKLQYLVMGRFLFFYMFSLYAICSVKIYML